MVRSARTMSSTDDARLGRCNEGDRSADSKLKCTAERERRGATGLGRQSTAGQLWIKPTARTKRVRVP